MFKKETEKLKKMHGKAMGENMPQKPVKYQEKESEKHHIISALKLAITWPTELLTCICVDPGDKNIQEFEFDEVTKGVSGVDDGADNENITNHLNA